MIRFQAVLGSSMWPDLLSDGKTQGELPQLERLNGRLEYFAVLGCYEFNRRRKEGVRRSSRSEGAIF